MPQDNSIQVVVEEPTEVVEDAYTSTHDTGIFTVNSNELLEKEEFGMTYANKVRRAVINKITKNGSTVPDDPEQLKILLDAAKAIDSQSIARKRIKVDEKNASAISDAKSVIRSLFNYKDAIIQEAHNGTIRSRNDLSALEGDLTLVEGEIEVNPMQETFEEFKSRMGS